MPATAPAAKKQKAATTESIAAASTNDLVAQLAAAATARLDTAYAALLAHAQGKSNADPTPILYELGWDGKRIDDARMMAKRAASTIATFVSTADAADKLEEAVALRDRRVPEIEAEISRLRAEAAELEHQPRVQSQRVNHHDEAQRRIRELAPPHIKAAAKQARAAAVGQLGQRWQRALGEAGRLRAMGLHDPQNLSHRETFIRAHRADGTQPWVLRDAQGRIVINPQSWQQHLRDERVVERLAELEEEIAKLEKSIAEGEVVADRELDYWLSVG